MSNSFRPLHFVDPSPTARRLLWHVLSIGTVSRDEPDHHKGFEKPGVHLFWVQSGHGTLERLDTPLDLKTGPFCWCVDMKKPRAYVPAPGMKLVCPGLRFCGPNLDAWREALGDSCEFAFPDCTGIKFLAQACRKLRRLVSNRPAGYEWKVHLVLTDVLGLLLESRGVLAALFSESPPAVRRVIEVVLADPARDWKVGELASLASVSISGLRSRFRHTQQEGIHEFLQRVRLDRARVLLCDKRLSIKQVADQLHFSSEFYFSHFFRSGAGMSPSQFRHDLKA
jgi:AraC-like DNA-binding protein